MKRLLLLASLFSCMLIFPAGSSLTLKPDIEYTFAGMLKEDMFAAKNFSLLNRCNDFDQVWFMRHTLDYIFNANYGRLTCGYPLVEFNFSVRNKGIWGAPSTLAQTTDSEIKIADVLTGKHNHYIPRHIFWMREGWLRFSIPDALQLPLKNQHTFMLGFFPFQLGRGIALGDAYALGQDFLGFYTDGLVDQFAPAAKFSGEIVDKRLFYDFYAACLENKSALISDTSAKVRAQEFGYKLNPSRGFGRINFLVASRLRWFVWPEDCGETIIIEPYWVYNRDPEQDIEFTADAIGTLGTIGFACDYVSKRVEAGFECAKNLGRQHVRGWDRNVVELQNRNGQLVTVNSHVLLGVNPNDPNAPSSLTLYKDPFAPNTVAAGVVTDKGRTAQRLIDETTQDAANNGQLIGTVDGLRDSFGSLVPDAVVGSEPNGLYNATNRFRDPYNNIYKGFMFVMDIAVWNQAHDLKIAAEGGFASGDDNPNFETIDGVFTGFIGLQEAYSGRKVRSAFVLGGAGKLKRPLSAPDPETNDSPNEFATNVSGFTNLIYGGTGLTWIPHSQQKRLSINPNIIAFWQASDTRKFDAQTNAFLPELASKYVGIEANLFAHYMLFDNLRLFLIASVFIPGKHYSDIKGIPLNSEQKRLIDKLDRTGFDRDFVPNLGDNTAYTFNVGLEFKF